MRKIILKGVCSMKDREKEIKYEMYLIKREMLELKKRLINLKTELNNLNENKTKTRKLKSGKNRGTKK